jgi:hypothetical protein
VSLPIVNLYKFCKREILIQPPGEPREQHLGDVRQKVRASQNFIKDKMTGRVNILKRIFEKIAKKVKIEVTGTKKRSFWLFYLKTFHKTTFLGPVTSILTFCSFLKNVPDH